jgi:hypoxanthine phosphoribosyltransferase
VASDIGRHPTSGSADRARAPWVAANCTARVSAAEIAQVSEPERETLTWELFGTASRELARLVAEDGYQADIVLAIARGGLFVAGALGYALDVKNLHVANVEFYTGVDERLPVPIMLPPVPNALDLSGARVLVADDVADTGATLKLVRDFCVGHVADVRCAVVYEKPHSTVQCEYVWRRTDRWINFPWSTLPPVVRRDGQVLDA